MRSGAFGICLLLSLWLSQSGMASAPVQGYRLMMPGNLGPPWIYPALIPYRWWDTIGFYEKSIESERDKEEIKSVAALTLSKMELGGPPPVGLELAKRTIRAECVPVR